MHSKFTTCIPLPVEILQPSKELPIFIGRELGGKLKVNMGLEKASTRWYLNVSAFSSDVSHEYFVECCGKIEVFVNTTIQEAIKEWQKFQVLGLNKEISL